MSTVKFCSAIFGPLFLFVLNSCRKDSAPQPPPGGGPADSGLYVLVKGAYSTGPENPPVDPYSSSLSLYRFASKTLVPDEFEAANGTAVGDGGNDLGIYGSKMYIVLFQSDVVRIVDAHSSKLLKTDSLVNAGNVIGPPLYSNQRLPQRAYFYQGQAFVSCADGTVAIIDTSSLEVTRYVTVGSDGSYPCGVAVSNGKLYVAISGGGLNDSLAIFNISDWSVAGKIQVFPYPTSVAADSQGHVYVLSFWGEKFNPDQTGPPFRPGTGGIVVINARTNEVVSQTVIGLPFPQPIAISGNQVYYVTYDSITFENKVAVLDAVTQKAVTSNFIADGTILNYASAICVSPSTREVFVASAPPLKAGLVYAFDKTGRLEYSFGTGIDPVKLTLLGR